MRRQERRWPKERRPKELEPSVSDWFVLRKLLPNDGVFNLHVRCVDSICSSKDGDVDFTPESLNAKFKAYFVNQESTRTFHTSKVLSFPSFFTAYRGWKERDRSLLEGHRIGIEPASGNLNNCDVHMVLVSQLPKCLMMSTFVTKFVKFPGLLFIDGRPRQDCAIIGYSTLTSAQCACRDVKGIKINNEEFTIVVQPLNKRPPMSCTDILKATGPNSLSQQVKKSSTPNEYSHEPVTSTPSQLGIPDSPSDKGPPTSCTATDTNSLSQPVGKPSPSEYSHKAVTSMPSQCLVGIPDSPSDKGPPMSCTAIILKATDTNSLSQPVEKPSPSEYSHKAVTSTSSQCLVGIPDSPLDRGPPMSCTAILNATDANSLSQQVEKSSTPSEYSHEPVVTSMISQSLLGISDFHNTSKHQFDRPDVGKNTKPAESSYNSTINQRMGDTSAFGNELLTYRACGFHLNYQQYFHMFHVTCGHEPHRMENFPDEITFLVTHQVEPIRFWGWLWSEDGCNAKELVEIEKCITNAGRTIKSPRFLPRRGHWGVALYKNESWFRCYVLSSNKTRGTIEVFFCDYGSYEVISKESFRYVTKHVWMLPPQAIPFKMFGFEIKDSFDLNNSQIWNLTGGNVLRARVVKASIYSQPHIVEIKDVTCVASQLCIDEKIIGASDKYIEKVDMYKCIDISVVTKYKDSNCKISASYENSSTDENASNTASVSTDLKSTSLSDDTGIQEDRGICTSMLWEDFNVMTMLSSYDTDGTSKDNDSNNRIISKDKSNSAIVNGEVINTTMMFEDLNVNPPPVSEDSNKKIDYTNVPDGKDSNTSTTLAAKPGSRGINNQLKMLNYMNINTRKSSNGKNSCNVVSLFDYSDKDMEIGLLSEAHHPSLLYLRLGELSRFSQLQELLDKCKLINSNSSKEGDVFLLHANGVKRRAAVLHCSIGLNKLKVLHVDHGVIEWVSRNNLYRLPSNLQDLPFQATPAALAGISCNDEQAEESVLYLKSMMNTVIRANRIREGSNGVIHVELFDASTGKSINKTMVDIGLAGTSNSHRSSMKELSPATIPTLYLTGLLSPPVHPLLPEKFTELQKRFQDFSVTMLSEGQVEIVNEFQSDGQALSNMHRKPLVCDTQKRQRRRRSRHRKNDSQRNTIDLYHVENRGIIKNELDLYYPPPDVVTSNKITSQHEIIDPDNYVYMKQLIKMRQEASK